MIWFVLGSFYAAGYSFSFLRIAGQMAWHFCDQDRKQWTHLRGKQSPDGEQWFGSIMAALVLALIWPVTLTIAYGLAGQKTGKSLFYMPPDEKEKIYKNRIKELERSVGL